MIFFNAEYAYETETWTKKNVLICCAPKLFTWDTSSKKKE